NSHGTALAHWPTRGHATWTTNSFWTMTMKNKKSPQTLRGFSTIELIITATILTIVTGLGLMGINNAKASIRLAGSAREFASYVEKARMYSIRRHADEANKR